MSDSSCPEHLLRNVNRLSAADERHAAGRRHEAQFIHSVASLLLLHHFHDEFH